MSSGEIFLTDGLKEANFRLVPRQSAPFARGGSQIVTYGAPYWVASFSYENLPDASLRALSAWLARREGARYSFTAWRPARKFPAASNAVNNTGIGISAVNAAASTISFTGLPCDLTAGDMVSYYTAASGFYFGEVMADAAEVSGAAVVSVKPAPLAPHASLSAPRIVSALCELELDGIPDIRERVDLTHSVSFTVKQVERY